MLNCSIPRLNCTLIILIFDIILMISKLDLYNRNMMLYWQLLRYCNSIMSMLFDIECVLIQICLTHRIFSQLLSIVWVRTGEFILHQSVLLLIFIHCLAFDIFYSNIMLIGCCCCALSMTAVVSMLMGRMIDGSSISLKLASTRGLRICLIMLHTLPTKELYVNCAIREIDTGRLFLLLIFVGLFFSNLL